jgi:hypothetical protein
MQNIGGIVRIPKTKWFSRFARKEGLADDKLLEALKEMESGLIDADYGGGLIKKRIVRNGGGKSGGYIQCQRNIKARLWLHCTSQCRVCTT